MRYSSHYDQTLESELHLLAQNYLSSSYGSKAIPNYQCKYCKQKVFFFRSSSGGKVLFDSLGKPWPKHNCLGIYYQQKQAALKISPNNWWSLSNLITMPLSELNHSIFSGVIPSKSGDTQNRVELEIEIEDPILVKEVYVDALAAHSIGKPLETLVLLDDGRHELHQSIPLQISSFQMEDLSGKKPYLNQPKLI